MRNAVATLLFLSVLSSICPAAQQDGPSDMNFPGQMVVAVEQLREQLTKRLDADPETKGRKLRLGKFGGPNLPDSNFELAFESKFESLMKDRLDDSSEFIVSGEYDFVPGQMPENDGLKVIRIIIKVVDAARNVLIRVVREINNTEDIAEITGATVAPPDTPDVKKRNEAVRKGVNPKTRSFHVRNGTQVTAIANKDYAVEIRKKSGGTGPLVPVVPANSNGFAFVDLKVGDTFEIHLYTYETKCDTSCVVTIDGLDVANTFCTDGKKYDGYVIHRAKGSTPGTHRIPGWLETTKRPTKNVYSFVVNELGKGAATAKKVRTRRGVINVKFFEAVPEGQSLPSRRFGEVGKGKPMDVAYKVKRMVKRQTPISNVGIRYSTR